MKSSLPNRFKNLKKILSSEAAYQLIEKEEIDTWCAGGCLLLGKALHAAYGGTLKGLYCRKNGRLQHCLVEITENGKPFYLDGDGISTRRTLLARWKKWERIDPEIRAWPSIEPEWVCPPKTLETLTDFLRKNLP